MKRPNRFIGWLLISVDLIGLQIKSLISFSLQDHAGPLYARPSKALMAGGLRGTLHETRPNSDDGHPNEELASAKQPHSGDSANSSLQNINTLDSGISNCYSSTSTPTQDLRCSSSTNKPNELSKQTGIKPNNESAASSSSSNNSGGHPDDLDNEAPKSLNKQIGPNDAAKPQAAKNEPETTGQSNEQKSGERAKPLEYYEISAEFGPAASRTGNRLLGEYHPVIMQKLKCYEISTEL